jgi:class 3 adenylate cyclase/tetratricopeptide (TPR) repeat protein
MQCPRCQHDNPSGVKFCGECGSRLESVCAACGASNPPGNKFCGQCGASLVQAPTASKFPSPEIYTPKHLAEKILISKSVLEGERKQVTVLFADMKGSMELLADRDPEEARKLLDPVIEHMMEAVHRYEGTVSNLMGDGIMALFGAPLAHEDHAVRACYAALRMQESVNRYADGVRRTEGVPIQVRVGLNSGEVVVGSIGNDLKMDYTAIGQTVHLAARMEQMATPGTVLVAEPIYRHISGYFETRPVGPLTVKGKGERVQAYEVLGALHGRTRLDLAAERGLTPYIGRIRELIVLSECFDKVKTGYGQVVFVVGEPGIGKSRLLLEFRRRLGEDATWLEGHSMSFGQSIAFHPLIDLLKRNFRIEESDTEETIVAKIERGVLIIGEELRPALQYIRHLLSVDPGDSAVLSMDPQLRRGEIFAALRRLLLSAAEQRPQVVVFEDLHWMDKATEECLQGIADSITRSRVLLIVTYRPEYHHPFGERSYHMRVALDALTIADSAEMTKAILTTERLPEELDALIVRKAEGNPFFVEEVVKSLQEIGAIRPAGEQYVLAKRLDEIFIPDTIQDVIMARIDRLAEAPKKTLQLASVIGREFTRRLVDRLAEIRERTEEFLRELKAIELIYEKSLFPELAYMFKHALTHEVAYNSLLVQRRKELHRMIGLAIEDLYANRLAEQYEVLGHHFSKAEDWAKALDYLLNAAEKATKAFAIREAVALYDHALEVAGRLSDAVDIRTLMSIHQAKMSLYFVLSDFESSRAEGERLLVLGRRLGDQVSEGGALAGMGLASLWTHDFDHALEFSRQAIEVATEVDAKPVLAGGHFVTGFVYGTLGRLDESTREMERALTISRQAGDVLHESLSLSFIGLEKNWGGNYDEASRLLSEGLRIARENNLVVPLLYSLFMHGVTLIGKGDYDAALINLEEGLALSEKVGDEVQRHRMLNSLGWLYIECGDLERAIDLSREGANGARKRGDPETIANPEINLGDIFLAKGDLTLANEFLDGVHRLVKDPATSEWMRWRYSTHLFASLGDLWLAHGDYTKAQEFCDHCLDIATRTQSKKYLVKGWRFKGEIALARRQWDEAQHSFRQALTIAQAIGHPTQLWKSHLALGQLHTDTKKPELAEQEFQAAREIIDRIKGSLQNPGLRASLEGAPMIQKIYDLSGK